jgi:hypothetical protein
MVPLMTINCVKIVNLVLIWRLEIKINLQIYGLTAVLVCEEVSSVALHYEVRQNHSKYSRAI